MDRLLLIDGYNMFIRGWVVIPALSSRTGAHVGGITGMLKMMQTSVLTTTPDKIFVIWDGAGGNRKRREQNKNYKAGRKPPKINRFNTYTNPEDENANRFWQQSRTIEYLNQMPIVQICEDGIEADDVISYIVNQHPEHKKVILSSDKDFCQLADKNTIIYRPISEEVITVEAALEKFGVHPSNLALSRAIEGDKSDNLPGVPGVGLKSLVKKMPFLKEDKFYTIEYLLEFAKEKMENDSSIVFSRIIENEQLIRENYGLMQLYTPNIHSSAKENYDSIMEREIPKFNNKQITSMFMEDGIFGLTLGKLFEHYNWMERIKND